MRKVSIAASAALLGLASRAFCADMQPYPGDAAPVSGPVSYWTWTGCYIGAHAGGGWGRREFVNIRTLEEVWVRTSGLLGGGQLGCNYQLPLQVVLGIEGEGDWTSIKGSLRRIVPLGSATSDQTFDVKTDWFASITGRVGYDWNRRLLYIKGGAAWARFESRVDIVNCIVLSGSGRVCYRPKQQCRTNARGMDDWSRT